MMQLYQSQKIPIYLLARFTGINIIELIASITNSKKIRLLYASGQEGKIFEAFELINNCKCIVLDFTALFTIHIIPWLKNCINGVAKPIVAITTFELIKHFLENLKEQQLNPNAIGCLFWDGESLVYTKKSNEEIAGKIKFIEQIISFIENQCEVSCCYGILDIPRRERKKIVDLLDKTIVDSICIAKERDGVFYCDDYVSCILSESQFGVKYTWTQPLFLKTLFEDLSKKETYFKTVIELIKLNYHYTTIDHNILLICAEQNNWDTTDEYRKICSILSENTSEIMSSISVACNFIIHIYRREVCREKRDILIQELLKNLFIDRGKNRVIKLMEEFICQYFIFPDMCSEEILSDIGRLSISMDM
jgi:hypothetical protein